MAETHRRVEARGIVGTGMSADPERIRDIEQRQARMERDHTLPKEKFGEVISASKATGVPKDSLWMDEPASPEKRRARGVPDPKGAALEPDAPEQQGAQERKGDTSPQGAAPHSPPAKQPSGSKPKSKPRERSPLGAGNAGVGQQLGTRARVTFKV